MNPCQICERPTNGFACTTCAAGMHAALLTIAERLTTIDEVRARVKAIAYGGPAVRSSDPGIHLDPRVSRVLDGLRTHLTTLARDVHEHDPSVEAAELLDHEDTMRLAIALTRHVHWLRLQQQGPEAMTTTARWAGRLVQLCDARPESIVLGECRAETEEGECHAIVYAPLTDPLPAWARCRACGYQHDVHARRDEILSLAHDHVATAREISGLLCSMTGQRVTPDAIRRQAARGHFPMVSLVQEADRLGRTRVSQTYRLGDVLRRYVA